MSYYIGLLSGTSVDSIDAAIVNISGSKINLIETHEQAFSKNLKEKIQQLIKSQQTTLTNLANCDHQLAIEFSAAVNCLISKSNLSAHDITAIGSHGQTIYHQPNDNKNKKSTIQIGSPHIIAANTGINVVANFRNMDMALDGQGAPLAPLLHQHLFSNKNTNNAIINLGGIANISFIGKDFSKVIGYDTGPANCLLDEWISIHHNKPYDKNGSWASQGTLNNTLLEQMLADPYFHKDAPKSTGREYFNYQWFENFKDQFRHTSAIDIQTTLIHLTAKSIAQEIIKQTPKINKITLMGGGAYNQHLVQLIESYTQIKIEIAENSSWIEALLFAYLAERRINNKTLNLSSITGSLKPCLLGDIIKI